MVFIGEIQVSRSFSISIDQTELLCHPAARDAAGPPTVQSGADAEFIRGFSRFRHL